MVDMDGTCLECIRSGLDPQPRVYLSAEPGLSIDHHWMWPKTPIKKKIKNFLNRYSVIFPQVVSMIWSLFSSCLRNNLKQFLWEIFVESESICKTLDGKLSLVAVIFDCCYLGELNVWFSNIEMSYMHVIM